MDFMYLFKYFHELAFFRWIPSYGNTHSNNRHSIVFGSTFATYRPSDRIRNRFRESTAGISVNTPTKEKGRTGFATYLVLVLNNAERGRREIIRLMVREMLEKVNLLCD